MELQQLLDGGEGLLRAWVSEGAWESLHLDFKSARGLISAGALSRDHRNAIAKAMSAFANSDGGQLIIGVECRRVDGIDRASDLQPVPSIDLAFSAVNGQLGDLLQPRHDGVRCFKIDSRETPGAGYIIIDVPRSERRPHMNGIERTYHKRSGAQVFTMEHYDVEDAFRRLTAPQVQLEWDLIPRAKSGDKITLRARLAVHNIGTITAKAITLSIFDRAGGRFEIDSESGERTVFRERTTISRNADFMVHPDSIVPIAYLEFHAYDARYRLGIEPRTDRFISAQYALGAENMHPVVGLFRVEPADLLAALDDPFKLTIPKPRP